MRACGGYLKLNLYTSIAQWIEHKFPKLGVVGSIPTRGTPYDRIGSMGKHSSPDEIESVTGEPQTEYVFILKEHYEDILRRIERLESQLGPIGYPYLSPYVRQETTMKDPTSTCPCRVENGGSGICNCIFGGTCIIC